MHSMTRLFRSFRYALCGITLVLKTQPNAAIHVLVAGAVIAAGMFLRFSLSEWCWIVLAITVVRTAEAFNTALELLADAVSPEFHPLVKKSKDAAAVLLSAVGAAAIGLLIFTPHGVAFFKETAVQP